jgi:predicted amidohydrolase
MSAANVHFFRNFLFLLGKMLTFVSIIALFIFMKIAVAQLEPSKGNITANAEMHKKLVHLAVAHGAEAIFFPELSLTGYEPSLAENLATTSADTLFDDFQAISNQYHITIGLGMPTRTATGIRISMVMLQPHQPRQTYSKQQLHVDELPFFVPGEEQLLFSFGHTQVAPGICYESMQPNHVENAHRMGAGVYVASVAKSQKGIDKAIEYYQEIARQYGMPVLMTNCTGPSENFLCVGRSSAWAKDGHLAAQMDGTAEGVLVFDTESEDAIIALC